MPSSSGKRLPAPLAAVAASLVAAVGACALSDYEVGDLPSDATADHAAVARRDAGHDRTPDAGSHGASKRDATTQHAHDGGKDATDRAHPDSGRDAGAPHPDARQDAEHDARKGARDSGAREAGHDAGHDSGHDGGHDAARDTGVVVAECVHKVGPGLPSGIDIPGTRVFTLALYGINLGDQPGVPVPGYDLDGTCTCIDDGGPSCQSSTGFPFCDFDGGVDNALKLLVSDVGILDPTFTSETFSRTAQEGYWSLLIQISGYGSTADGGVVANDPHVDVSLFPSPGPVTSPPAWDGGDSWIVSGDAVYDGGLAHPRYASSAAYVSNHVLLAALPATVLTMAGGAGNFISVRLSEGFLTGTLTMVDGQLEIDDGVLAARWGQHDIFASLSSYRPGSQGQGFCTNSVLYQTARSTICSALDIRLNSADPAALPCDALSLGIGFTAKPIQPLSEVAPPVLLTDGGCAPDADPINDSCGGDLPPDAG